uniref:Putative zinc-binding oxidoreductase n=2 Tax=Ornithodoros turicata TaxID=34597 RepID=A0A2R5LKY1_9ACAR
MRAVEYVSGGGPEQMHISPVKKPVLKEKEILIRVHTTSINRADLMQRKGMYPPPPGASEILGLEAAGLVEKCGEGCSRWMEGDRVMALLSGGGYAEFVTVHEDHVMEIPESMTFEDAGGIPEAWLTAYQLLYKVADVKAGQKVLIHAGGSGVGLAVVQLARLAGAEPIVIAGAADKLLRATQLGAAAAYNYKKDNIVERVSKFTQGHGVDILLDCIGRSMLDENCRMIAVDGCWVLYGLMSGSKIESSEFLSLILRKRVRLQGTTLRSRSTEYKAQLIKDFVKDVLPRFSKKELQVAIDKVYPLGQISQAHKYVESNSNVGKVVIRVCADLPSPGQEHSEII